MEIFGVPSRMENPPPRVMRWRGWKGLKANSAVVIWPRHERDQIWSIRIRRAASITWRRRQLTTRDVSFVAFFLLNSLWRTKDFNDRQRNLKYHVMLLRRRRRCFGFFPLVWEQQTSRRKTKTSRSGQKDPDFPLCRYQITKQYRLIIIYSSTAAWMERRLVFCLLSSSSSFQSCETFTRFLFLEMLAALDESRLN